jgi:outer membrane protein assembly factor BamD
LRLVLAVLALALSTAAAAAPREVTPEDRYALCIRYMQRAYYTKALEQCNRVRNYHRDDPVSVKAELAIADIHFKKGDYEQARLAYEDFARLHPRHPDLDYVVYRVGLSIWKRAPRVAGRDQTGTRSAVNRWTGFSTRFPDSAYREEVETLLDKGRDRLARKELVIARYYARKGNWGATTARVEGLLDRYPDSSHVPAALAMLARGKHAWGETETAAEVRESLARQFPDSRWLERVDRWLARAPGAPPEEEIFVRPYRYPGMMFPGMGMY